MATPAAVPATTPAPKTRADICGYLDTRLPYLPTIMRNKGWSRGAELMEQWLKSPSNSNPKVGFPNNSTITMAWVLQFARAKNAFDEAIREKIWLNSKAQEEIVKTHIVKANKVPPKDGREIAFGDAGDGRSYGPQAMLSFHNGNNVQYKKVAQGFLAPLDDLAAALANFHFHFVVRGKVHW